MTKLLQAMLLAFIIMSILGSICGIVYSVLWLAENVHVGYGIAGIIVLIFMMITAGIYTDLEDET
jgi:hypothetical protein